jgi:hypothetical protein
MKEFLQSSCTKQQLRKHICLFAKGAGVNRITFNRNGKTTMGTYNAVTKAMYLNTRQTKQDLLRTFFHELGHHIAVEQKKWINFHYGSYKKFSFDMIFAIENGVDKIAQKLWNKYVCVKKWGCYKYFYPKRYKTHIIEFFISKYYE